MPVLCEFYSVFVVALIHADGPPQDNPEMPPTGWVITLLGDVPGMKMQEATTVAFTPSVKEWCDKYREVKEVFFKVMMFTCFDMNA